MKFKNRIPEIDALQKEINRHRPLNRGALKQLKEYYRVGLTFSSNALEGNSLTESETKVVLEDGITIGGKPLKDHYEAVGHSEAYDFMHKLAKKNDIMEKDILKIHELFYQRIDVKNAGRYRNLAVIITGSRLELPASSKLRPLMRQLEQELPDLRKKYHPVEFAALLHIKLAAIHPFKDGNGRTARLLMNLALMQEGFPITIIPPVLRNDYLDLLKASDTGDHKPFIHFISCMVYESQKDYLRLLENLGKE